MTRQSLDTALGEMGTVAATVGPADLDRPTPCAGWDVRRLIEHVLGWQQVFAARARDVAPPFDGVSSTYLATEEPVADLRTFSAELAEELARRWERPVDLPCRRLTPVAAHVEELVVASVLHRWDLTMALGRDLAPDTETLAVAHRGLTRLLAEPFAPIAFAASVPGVGTDLPSLVARRGRALNGAG